MPPQLRLRRLALPAVALTAAFSGALAPAAPATAAVSLTTSSEDMVLYQHCQQHPIHYDLSVGPLTGPWRIEVQVVDPSDHTSEGTILNSADSPPLSGTTYHTFCGSEEPGTWTVRSVIRYTPIDLTYDTVLATSTFEVRPMQTRTRLTDKRLANGRHRLVAKVRQEAPEGYERADGITVRLERKAGSAWQRVGGLTLTTTKGRAATVVTGRGTYRAVVTGRGNHAGSTSQPVRTR